MTHDTPTMNYDQLMLWVKANGHTEEDFVWYWAIDYATGMHEFTTKDFANGLLDGSFVINARIIRLEWNGFDSETIELHKAAFLTFMEK